MQLLRTFWIILMVSGTSFACSQEVSQEESQNAINTDKNSIEAELQVMNEFFESSKVEKKIQASLNEGAESHNQSKPSIAPKTQWKENQTSKTMTEAALQPGAERYDSEESIFARVNALKSKVASLKSDAQTKLKELDRKFQASTATKLEPKERTSTSLTKRAPECAAMTSAIIGNKKSRDLYAHLTGGMKLRMKQEERLFLRNCALKGDGLALFTLILDRIETSPINGSPSPEWLIDALLTAGEYGAFPAGPLADKWIRNFAEKQYIKNGLYFRLINLERMSRLKQLTSISEEREADIDAMLANRNDIQKLIKNQQNMCWQTQQTYRALPEGDRKKYEKILREASPQQEETCLFVGVEILYKGTLPRHSVEWAKGSSKISFRSGNKLVEMKEIARLLDNWQKARTRNNWNSSYSNFVHFSDSLKRQYLAGYDPYSHRYGDKVFYKFRILRLKFGYYREILNAYWQPDSDISYTEFGSIEEARKHAKKIILALEPGLHFMMGHYEEEGLWDWLTLESDLKHPTVYTDSIPFHEYELMLAGKQ